jgi:predicted RNA binding protein YcfA (HicA-like mRNA interferase family)
MKLRRDLKGAELAEALCRHWEYALVHQVGSHLVLQTLTPASHRVAVPAHSPLRIGTLNSILKSVANHKGVSRQRVLDSL